MKLALTTTGASEPHVWPLDAPSVRIGRDETNAVRIRHRSVSRQHAMIALRRDRAFLTDLHSKNGTYLNGDRVRGVVPLRAGDRIQVGRIPLLVTSDSLQGPCGAVDVPSDTTFVELPPSALVGTDSRVGTISHALIQRLEAFGHFLAANHSVHATFDALLGAVEGTILATRLQLILRQEPSREPTIVASRPRLPCLVDPPLVPMTTLRGLLERGHCLLIPDPRAKRARRPEGDDRTLPTAMAVPVLHRGRSLGLLYAEHRGLVHAYGREHVEILSLFANLAALRVVSEQMKGAEITVASIEHELQMAGRIQRWLLPSPDVTIAGYDVHAALQPCHAVGGDFYDFHTDAGGDVWILVGDVSGSGICGAILMSTLLSSARILYDDCREPAHLARRLNGVLRGYAGSGNFVTAFMGRLRPDTGRLDFVNAGHTYPLLVARGPVQSLESTGPPFGVDPEWDYRPSSVEVPPGALLALFSDGLPEARRGRREGLFGDRRTAAALRRAAQCGSLEDAESLVLRQVDEFLAGQPRTDDITLVLLRRRAGGGAIARRPRPRPSTPSD